MRESISARRWVRAAGWAALAGYWSFMIYETHSPAPLGPGPIIPHLDKALHFFSFGLLGAGLTLGRAIFFWNAKDAWLNVSRRLAIVSWLSIAAFGVLDELTQPLTGRSCDPFDWLADATGSALGILLATSLLRRRWRNRRERTATEN